MSGNGAKRRSGYVLLIVLAALTLATTLLVQFATRTHLASVDALYASRDLQHRWGQQTLVDALLPRVEEVLIVAYELAGDQGESTDNLPATSLLASVPMRIELGGIAFRVILADEGAKLNLNVLPADQGDFRKSLAGLVTMSGISYLREQGLFDRPCRSWGEVFDIQKMRLSEGDDRALAGFTRQVTLWGSGRLNIQRASREAVVNCAATVVTQSTAERLWERYEDSRRQKPAKLLISEIATSDVEKLALERLLGDGSACYSVWIESGTIGSERQQRFYVGDIDETGVAVRQVFVLD